MNAYKLVKPGFAPWLKAKSSNDVKHAAALLIKMLDNQPSENNFIWDLLALTQHAVYSDKTFIEVASKLLK